MGGIQKFLSGDDLWSALGWVALMALTRATGSDMAPAASSLLASGMLAIFWLGSRPVRERNAHPNARVAFWVLVAVASAIAYAL